MAGEPSRALHFAIAGTGTVLVAYGTVMLAVGALIGVCLLPLVVLLFDSPRATQDPWTITVAVSMVAFPFVAVACGLLAWVPVLGAWAAAVARSLRGVVALLVVALLLELVPLGVALPWLIPLLFEGLR